MLTLLIEDIRDEDGPAVVVRGGFVVSRVEDVREDAGLDALGHPMVVRRTHVPRPRPQPHRSADGDVEPKFVGPFSTHTLKWQQMVALI